MNYTYSGDQVTRVDTCVLDATTPRTESYGYDQLVRSTSGLQPNFAAVGGSFSSRNYDYDGRGNRTTETPDATAMKDKVLASETSRTKQRTGSTEARTQSPPPCSN